MHDTKQVINPYDGSIIGEVKTTDWQSIDTWLDRANALHQNKSEHLPKSHRAAILIDVAQQMQQRFKELALLIANEGGKPLIDAKVEVGRAIEGVRLCVKELEHIQRSEVPMHLTTAGKDKTAYTIPEPIGVVVAISAFNHPLNLIVHQVATAVAVGCPVIVKPSENTPLSAHAFVEMLHTAGLPEAWCRYAVCENTVAERMATDPRVAFLNFIGSAKVGWMLKSKLAPGTRCTLEHGGAAPVIIDETADIATMIPQLVKGGFYHSGQVCVSVQRVYAPASLARSIAEKIAQHAERLVVGNPVVESTECGPLIQPKEVERVHTWVQEAIVEGAELICGGKKVAHTCYRPTVLLNPSANSQVSTEEIFGPVIAVYHYDTLKAAIQSANALPYAFQAAVFSQNEEVQQQVIQSINASTVMINEHTAFRVDSMPFGGRKLSGYGTGGISHTMREMLENKLVIC